MAFVSQVGNRFQCYANRVRVPRQQLGAGDLAGLIFARVRDHQLALATSHIAFRLVFALFPGLIAFLWLARLLNGDGLVDQLMGLITTVMPSAAQEPVREQLVNAPEDQANGSMTLPALVSLVIAVFAVSSAFRSSGQALDTVCEVKDDAESLHRQFLVSLAAALGAALLMAFAVVAAVTARELGGAGKLPPIVGFAWLLVSWAAVFVTVLIAFTLVYYFAPTVKQGFQWVTLGGIFAAAVWLVYTIGFGLYVNEISDPKQTYGALGGIAIVMIYVYATVFIMLVGAEVNAVLAGSQVTEEERVEPSAATGLQRVSATAPDREPAREPEA